MRWTIGASCPDPEDAVLSLTLEETRSAKAARAHVVRFDDLLAGAEIESAQDVLVRPSMWRGHSFIALCEWIACAKLTRPGSRVVWEVPARGGATGVRKVLTDRGWEFSERKGEHKRQRVFEGAVPDPGPPPMPRSFTTTLGHRELVFEADWGVFSLGHVDEGTRALFEVAMATPATSVADVGTGYGAIAVGLAASRSDVRVFASDVDLVALYLTRRNAVANGAAVELICDDDPSALPVTGLTTCEIPTHVAPAQTRRLVSGLVARSRTGMVLVAVHNGLVQRYVGLFAEAGAERADIVDGATHAVLRFGG